MQEQLEKLTEEHEKKSNELKTLSTSKLELDQETVTLKTSYESLEKEFNELKTNRKSIEEKCETVSEEKEILSHELADIKKVFYDSVFISVYLNFHFPLFDLEIHILIS